jgi:2,3-bisphosphoglycerate-dependent phosphoglycerate mutase
MKRLTIALSVLVFAFVATAAEPAPLTTIILVRHAEKVADPSTKDPALTSEGEARAKALAAALSSVDVTTMYTTPYIRTRSTGAPLAAMKKLTPVEINAGATFADDMAARLREHRGGTIVVVGHSNTTQDVMKALGIANAPKIEDWQYDDLFVVTIGENVQPAMAHLKYGAPSVKP